MPAIGGVNRELSLPRRWISDLMAATHHIPTVAGEGRMRVGAVDAARRAVKNGPTWMALFLKAYAIVAQRRPELRRVYIPWPRPHLFEAEHNFASISVARDYGGEPAVFFGQVRRPETKSLAEIAKELQFLRSEPIERVRPYARLLKYARYPLPIRRLAWWTAMRFSGRHFVKSFGTFSVSVFGGTRARILSFRAPTPVNLSFGAVDKDGTTPVVVSVDHRVIDGMAAVRALHDVEGVMNRDILAELRAMAEMQQPAAAA